MKVGILGSGDVAKALAGGFLKHGHDVTMGTRSPAKLKEWAAQNPKAAVGSFSDAASFASLIVLAVKGKVATEGGWPISPAVSLMLVTNIRRKEKRGAPLLALFEKWAAA
jgi:pyrroline-5-carboxylate reductase